MAGHLGYCDFDVAVARVEDGFEVRVLGSPAGETGAVGVAADVPMTSRDVVLARGTSRDVGTASAGIADRERVGGRLFDLLFHGEALDRFRESQRRAAAQDLGVRIVLRAGVGADTLPWELLYDTSSRRFLALDPRTPFVRCVEMPARPAVPAHDGPLRILVAVATPVGSTAIDADRELEQLRNALDPFVATRVLELVPLLDASLDGIRGALDGRDIHILHYIGHGSRTADGQGVLELTRADGTASPRTGAELGVVLTAAPTLRLVVLNCCHGASTVDDDPFAGAAAALVRSGVPAVLAMRHAIGDRSAIELCREFYSTLVDGARVEEALTTARRALFVRDDSLADDWPTAALYLGSSIDTELTASPLPRIDEDAQFTVARPAELRANRWESMLVFGHRSEPYVRSDGAAVDPHQQVQQRVASFFGPDAAGIVTALAEPRSGVPHGAGLVVVPDLPDVECSPTEAPMSWSGELEEARFLLRAGGHREGSSVHGWVRVFCGALIIAETAVEFAVVSEATAAAPVNEQPVESFRRIFPCFSPEDIELVNSVAAVAESLGGRYTAEVIDGRRDDAPDEWMLPLIGQADVFQLFWSSHSMRSVTCRRQWEVALATGRPGFIRPLYWEHPFPNAPGLPPPPLERLRFIRVPSWSQPARAATEQWRVAPPGDSGSVAGADRPRPGATWTTAEPERSPPPPTPPAPPPKASVRSGGLGVAGVFGLVAAVVAAVVTTSLSGDSTSPDIGPPVPPPGDGGSSPLVVVAVAIGAFALAFVLALLVVRRRR